MNNIMNPIKDVLKEYLTNDLEDYVCVIGGSNVDIAGSSPVIKNNESNIGKVSISPGGVARNVAENLGRLGIPTIFISAIGNDHFGDIIIDSLKQVNVDLAGLRRIANMRTGSYLVMLDDFRNMDFAINDMAIIEHVDKEWIRVCKDIISKAKIVVLDCNLKSESIEAIIELANGNVFVDTVSMAKAVNVVPYLNDIWAIKPNTYEAEAITNIKIESFEDAIKALKALYDNNVKNAIITMGKKGILVNENGIIKHYFSNEIRPVNVTGAGDAFLATWVASEFLNIGFADAIKNAMIASIKTTLSMETVSKDLSRINFEKWKQEVEIYEEILEY